MKLLTGIIFLLLSFQSLAYTCGDNALITTTKQDGNKIGLFASAKDFEGAPRWTIQDGEPPLSISTAVSLAQQWATSFYPRFDSVVVDSFQILKYGC